MSNTTPTASSSFSPKLHATFEASLKEYEKKTEESLLTHPLLAQLQDCNSPADILVVLRSQLAQFGQNTSADDKFIKCLVPIVNVLGVSSSVISAGVGLVFSPANVIFAGAGIILSATKDVITSQDGLITIFEGFENLFKQLDEHAEVPTTEAVKDIMVKLMVEVLEIFAIMTKEIKQGRAKISRKNFFKKLIGRKGIKNALSRLDTWTQEAVEIMKAAGPEEEKRYNMIQLRRKRVREDRAWLSPPDPSTNQHIAHNAQHQGTATWFFEGDIFTEWKSKSTASLLWIYGKPGSGKSVLCSAIIQDILALQEAGQATIAYFYFDFRETDKQDLRNALASLLTQLSAYSDSYCDILSHVHQAHDNGAYKPSVRTMITSFKEMLALPDQGPVYIILDAIDECSDYYSAHMEVLTFLTDLVGLQLPNFHVCVTSRPEFDIRTTLEPLVSSSISIHDQNGQKMDINDYIRSAVHAGSDTAMKGWRDQDKELVIDTLSESADGMFRWVCCQLEVLQRCPPQNIRQVLSELPASLDETFEHILSEIRTTNVADAYRLLQCLCVAARPLRIEELAEIFLLDSDRTEGATPKINEDRQWGNPEQAVLSLCSSLIMVVDTGHSRVVQFSHFSVKEFLTSNRLATYHSYRLATHHSNPLGTHHPNLVTTCLPNLRATYRSKDISQFYIALEAAHTTLTQACLATLLRLDGGLSNDQVERNFPLAGYASQHLVEHAQLGKVPSRIEGGIQRLFDSTKPYFSTWLRLYNIDDHWNQFGNAWVARGSPLYYASLCGFRDLAEQIINVHPEQVNATGGRRRSPLAAALCKGHFHVAELLLQHGASVDVTDHNNQTLLQAASVEGRINVARWLLDRGADPNSEQNDHVAPIHLATANGHPEVIQTLLEHGVDIHSTDKDGRNPLHLASSSGKVEIVRLLLEHGANANSVDNDGCTPLSLTWTTEVERLLLDHYASPDEGPVLA